MTSNLSAREAESIRSIQVQVQVIPGYRVKPCHKQRKTKQEERHLQETD